MSESASSYKEVKYYSVWDRTTRLFHWINVICIVGLSTLGVAILNYKVLGVHADGKILLKTIHAYIGYAFVLNLLWRFIWAFVGNEFSRWGSILPIGKGYWQSLREYMHGLRAGDPPQYLGHNPLAKLMVAFLFLLLSLQSITGLVLAGTDLYLPPFGHEIAEWVAPPGASHEDIAALKPGSKEGVNPETYAEMRDLRKPIANTHYYTFYILLIAIVLHIVAVVYTEVKEKNGIISAMFTGKKFVFKKLVEKE